MKKLLTWPKSALDATLGKSPHVDYLYMVLGFIASFIEFVVLLQLKSTALFVVAFLAIWITGRIFDYFHNQVALVYTLGAWLFFVLALSVKLIQSILH